MHATKGLPVSLRTSGRLIGCVALALALSAMVFASTASAKPRPITHTYLSLGDSLAFGYSQQLFNENEKAGEPPSAFDNGFTDDYFKYMKGAHNGVQLTNDGCPGETSSSLIGNGPLGQALETSPYEVSTEAPCAYHNVDGLPLHNEYLATYSKLPLPQSQLENALEEVAVDAAFGKPVSTVTLDIGANDELAQVHSCEREVGEEYAKEGKSKYGPTPESAVHQCLTDHVPSLIEKLVKNIGAIFYTLRNGETFGGVNYTGQICYVASYDPYGAVYEPGVELLSGSDYLATLINKNVDEKAVEPNGVEYADALPVFNPGGNHEPVRLKEWTNMANTMEFEGKKDGPDIHPTPAGYKELAKIMKGSCKPAV
jgi:lysophospholipase L1-like esterase